jgi:hypothetical protein
VFRIEGIPNGNNAHKKGPTYCLEHSASLKGQSRKVLVSSSCSFWAM